MQDNLKCGFCNDEYNSSINIPKNLPCGHIKCSVCLNAEFRKSQQYICIYCKGVFKNQPQNLLENEDIIKRIKIQEAKKQSIGIEKLKEEKNKIQFAIKNIAEQQSFICKRIIDQLDTTLFSKSNQIIFQLSLQLSVLNKKIRLIEQDSSLEDEEDGNQIESSNVEALDLQKIDTWLQQGQQETQKLNETQKQLLKQSEKMFEDASRGEFFYASRVQRNIPVNNERQENSRSVVRESFIHTYRQRQHLIHLFEDCSQNLHLFDVEQRKYDKINLTISIPQWHRSIEYQGAFYMIGGYDKMALKNVLKVNYQGICEQMKQLNFERYSFGIAAAKDYLFVVGGANNYNAYLEKVEKLSLKDNSKWQMCNPMLFEIGGQTLCTDKNEEFIYSYGGNSKGQATNQIIQYSVQNDK